MKRILQLVFIVTDDNWKPICIKQSCAEALDYLSEHGLQKIISMNVDDEVEKNTRLAPLYAEELDWRVE